MGTTTPRLWLNIKSAPNNPSRLWARITLGSPAPDGTLVAETEVLTYTEAWDWFDFQIVKQVPPSPKH